jgi:AhpD family alkylhydroperoxidase
MANDHNSLRDLQTDTHLAFAKSLHAVRASVPKNTLALMDRTLQATHAQERREDASPLSEADQAVADFCDQFVMGVGQTSDSQRNAVRQALGDEGSYQLANALYLTDMYMRLSKALPTALGMTLDLPLDHAEAQACSNADLDELISRFAAAAVRAEALDPMVSEMVRLRCAQTHRCRLCASLRVDQALEKGLNEDMVAMIAQYQTAPLANNIKAALELADALILQPLAPEPGLLQRLTAHFTDQQISEMCFDVVKWSQQKALVALDLDEPQWQETFVLSFDDVGHPVFAGPVAEHQFAPASAS